MRKVNRRQLAGGMAAAAASSMLQPLAQIRAATATQALQWRSVLLGIWLGATEVHTPVRDRYTADRNRLAGLLDGRAACRWHKAADRCVTRTNTSVHPRQ